MLDLEKDFVHLTRLALEGRMDEVKLLAARSIKTLKENRKDLSKDINKLSSLLSSLSNNRSVLAKPIPVDSESRLELLKKEVFEDQDMNLVLSYDLQSTLNSVVEEKRKEVELLKAGLAPSKTLLFVGPPGVGKTLSAKWLAAQLSLPLLTLDLAAVMSSFLGKTGNNIRTVLDYAQRHECILLLDEFDAIAKRRDDSAEVGELKRLVTVILQSVDEWPSNRLLIAATNHPELLDPAIWRRFDRVLEFKTPNLQDRTRFVEAELATYPNDVEDELIKVLAILHDERSYSEIGRFIKNLKKASVLSGKPLEELLETSISSEIKALDKKMKIEVARSLDKIGFTQRRICSITGHSRDTLREHGIGLKNSNSEMTL